jgi:hypothetical protein
MRYQNFDCNIYVNLKKITTQLQCLFNMPSKYKMYEKKTIEYTYDVILYFLKILSNFIKKISQLHEKLQIR